MDLTERLIALRKAWHLTQQETAKVAGLTYRSYRRYEAGEREPTLSALWQLADFFDVTIDYLVGRSETGTRPRNIKSYRKHIEG